MLFTLFIPLRVTQTEQETDGTAVAGAKPFMAVQHFLMDEETVVAHEGSQSSVLAAGVCPEPWWA